MFVFIIMLALCLQSSAGRVGQVGSNASKIVEDVYLLPIANRQEETRPSAFVAY